MQTMHFDVHGMTCGDCTGSVQRAVSQLDGVSYVEVTLRPGTATVQADPARVKAAQIARAITDLGYEAAFRPPDPAGDAMS
jgi:copper chaperone